MSDHDYDLELGAISDYLKDIFEQLKGIDNIEGTVEEIKREAEKTREILSEILHEIKRR